MARFHDGWILEMCILALLSSQDAYGYEIIKNPKLGISESTVYPVLRRLKDQKLLTVYSEQHNTRLRKIYQITEDGRKALEERKDIWKEFQNNVNAVLGGSEVEKS